MKKRIARILIYCSLAGFALVVLSHPYVWQNLFGPKIQGEPFWAWQEEFRNQQEENGAKPTLWVKLLNLLHLDPRPMPWLGRFPYTDPEMLPVLLSLKYDPSDPVRAGVASALGDMPPDEIVLSTLIQLLDDPAVSVREGALWSLRRFGPKSEAALPKLRELLDDADPDIQMHAALVMLHIGQPSPKSFKVLRASLQSPLASIRHKAFGGLTEQIKDEQGIFEILVERSRNDPNDIARHQSVFSLKLFGKRAVPNLNQLLHGGARKGDHSCVIATLGWIGPDASEAIPTLERYRNDPDEEVRAVAIRALKQIDPKR